MRVGILGPLEVAGPDGPVAVRGLRLRALLARLALEPGAYVGVEQLAASLWGDDVPLDQANALQSLVSRLRRLLPDPTLLQSRPGGYRLDLPPGAVDAVRFEQAARDARALAHDGDAVGAARRLRDGLDLWRGPALADLAEVPFAAAPAARLEELRLSALEDRVAADLTMARTGGQAPDLVAELDGLTAAHPLRERLWVLLVTALRDDGRPAEALAAFERARTVLADELGADPGPELRDLHTALLRGEAQPAPRRPATTRRARAPLTSFVGRSVDLARIAELLATSRLVTLVGPGGAGKTRLALQAADNAATRFGGNVWTVELASVNDPDDIGTALLGALMLRETNLLESLRESAAPDPVGRVVDALASRSGLLVLDNCEHLVAGAAAVAEHLLTSCPALRVLATSREPLAIFGEALCPVPPLGLPPAGCSPDAALTYPSVRLFADRAAAVVPGFAVDDRTVGSVIQVCRRLDGLPLAIELAAARLRSLPLAEVEARLDDRFRLLTGGSRTAVARHRTLRAVVEWSWDLLDEPERRLADRLSVLVAGATVDSSTAMCADPGVTPADALDLLTALVDKSLLQVTEGVDVRYRMLETLREYGTERLAAAGELTEARATHARFVRDLVEQADSYLHGEGQLEWIRRLSDERDNVLAALRFAADSGETDTALRIGAAMGWFWFLQGSYAEVATWLERVVAMPGDEPADARAACLALYVMTAWGTGSLPDERLNQLAVQVDEAVVRASDAVHRYSALGILVPVMSMVRGDSSGAAAAVREALSTVKDPWSEATLYMLRGMLRENDGDAAGMQEDLALSLDRYRALGDRWGMATTTAGLATTLLHDGDADGAIAMLAGTRQWLQELQAGNDEAETLLRMASAHLLAGRPDEADRLIAEAEELAREVGSGQLWAYLETVRGYVARARGAPAEARRCFEAALARGPAVQGPPQVRVGTMVGLMHLDVDEGRLAEARALAATTVPLGLQVQDMPIVATIAVAVARMAAAQGEPGAAARLLGAARAVRGLDDRADADLVGLTTDLRTALGAACFEAAYGAGAALDRAAALAELRQQVTAVEDGGDS